MHAARTRIPAISVGDDGLVMENIAERGRKEQTKEYVEVMRIQKALWDVF